VVERPSRPGIELASDPRMLCLREREAREGDGTDQITEERRAAHQGDDRRPHELALAFRRGVEGGPLEGLADDEIISPAASFWTKAQPAK
jgi:hypothetical protein